MVGIFIGLFLLWHARASTWWWIAFVMIVLTQGFVQLANR